MSELSDERLRGMVSQECTCAWRVWQRDGCNGTCRPALIRALVECQGERDEACQERDTLRAEVAAANGRWQSAVKDMKALRAEVERKHRDGLRLRKRIARLEAAIRWALGYEEGPPRFDEFVSDTPPLYRWRSELRRRAALAALAEKGGDDG